MLDVRLDGEMFARGEPGYEAARSQAVWNARTPERYPDVVVQAASEADVVAAVRAAAARRMKIGVRSGGHSWAGSHVRDGGMLLDLRRLQEVTIDAGSMTATTQPGRASHEMLGMLEQEDLFFPAGHCPGVGVGGYLLQGGYGWNGRVHGPACMSVHAIDVVTAAGRLVHADENQNSDLLWAARGSGPGFFGVVTRFYVRLQPRPREVVNCALIFAREDLEDVLRWCYEIGPQLARIVELNVMIHRDPSGEVEIVLAAPALAASEREARDALAVFESCPLIGRAKIALPYVKGQISDLYAGVHSTYPDEHRYAVDNIWTHAHVEDLLPGIVRIADTLPPAPSHMLWMNWQPGLTPQPARPDMAYSLEDDTYIACYGVWQDAADDDANVPWATQRMREMEHLSSGIQLADENLGERPSPFMSAQNMVRLDELRRVHDPAGMFHPWMGRAAP